jgi:hypothetical protein
MRGLIKIVASCRGKSLQVAKTIVAKIAVCHSTLFNLAYLKGAIGTFKVGDYAG